MAKKIKSESGPHQFHTLGTMLTKNYRKLYSCDNGALICEDHLGMSAKYTGHDISGLKIMRVNAAYVKEFAAMGLVPKCERCGCEASVVSK